MKQIPDSKLVPTLHGVILTVLWGILIDVSVMVVRYLKTSSSYIRIHWVIMFLINTTTLALALLMVLTRFTRVFYNFSTMSIASRMHFLMGMSLLFSIVLQHISGIIVKRLKENPKIEA